MRLTERNCNDCGDKFDLIKDKYFLKKPNRFKQTIEIIIKVIVPTLMRNTIFETKLICEACNRNDKLKNLGV
jgi:hypothetical protein